jgi:hypothetical protein
MNNRDYIKNIKDIMLCIQTMVRSRFGKRTKIIFTKGRYSSAYLSFYKSPWVIQFYCEDKMNDYVLYLLKNERVAYKEIINRQEPIELFYTKLSRFFRII